MKTIWRLLHAERGVALMSIMVAVFILTIVVAAMAIATMGETTLSFDQLRGQQAVGVAEAGAYRALAEVRRRMSVNLDTVIRTSGVTEADMQNICNGSGGRDRIEVITDYAYPGGSSDWTHQGSGATATAYLRLPSSGVIQMTDASGTIGDFYAEIRVRWSGATSACNSGPNVPDQFAIWFDYAIFAVGRAGNATRTVCLRSPFADRCPDWLGTVNWQGSWTLAASQGWPVVVEQAAYSQWALMLLSLGSVWLYTGAQVNGPVHSNAELRIAGDPILADVVTTVNTQMRFLNCGTPNWITIPAAGDPNATLRNPGCDNTNGSDPSLRSFQSTVTGGAASVSPPSSSNPSRTSVGLSPTGPNATDLEVAARTTDLPDGTNPIPDGLYVMDQCPPCTPSGGFYVKGNVSQMLLASESDNQVIYVTVPTNPDVDKRNLRIVINPTTRAVTVYWGAGWTNSQAYPANTFNGIIYSNGNITSTASPSNPGGLWGMLNRNMRMTIATEGEMRITDHLVYENPPAGPGHNPVNVLGLWSVNSDITIHGAVSPDNLYIDAAILSPASRFWVEGWDTLPLKGNIYFLGGTVQGSFGAWGGFSPDTGYGRIMTYDWRLRSNVSPPFFPQTDVYTAIRWPSPIDVFANGDRLYERPHWEEMVGL